MLLEEVKTNLADAVDSMDTPMLIENGAMLFGVETTRVGRTAEFFIPSKVPPYQATTSETTLFGDLQWEAIFEDVWPIELNYFAMTWEERKSFVIEEYQAETLTARRMMYLLALYWVNGNREEDNRWKACSCSHFALCEAEARDGASRSRRRLWQHI
eukprot:2114069-Amphidinium_carterae.2